MLGDEIPSKSCQRFSRASASITSPRRDRNGIFLFPRSGLETGCRIRL